MIKNNLKKIPGFIFDFYFPSEGKRIINKLKKQRSQYQRVLNIGGGNKKYGFRQEINLDIAPLPQVDVVADAHHLPFGKESFDLVIANVVLEHVENPAQVVKEIYRVLKKGGRVYAMVPFLQRYHPYPQDYTRWTADGIERLFRRFKTIEKGVSAGPWVSFVEFNIGLLRLISQENKFIFFLILIIFLPLLTLLRPFFLLIPKNRKHILANAFYYLGEK